MENDILFLSIFTRGMRDLAINHLFSLKQMGITNTLSFCSDKETVEILNAKGFQSLENPTPINKDIFSINDSEFNKFSYFKYIILINLLKKHKYIWYLDVDTVVTKDIRNYIYDDYDIIIQDDINQLSSACIFVKNTENTIELLNTVWNERNIKYNDQIILNKILRRGEIPIRGYTLSIAEFRPGLLFFDEKYLITLSENVKKMRKLFVNNKETGSLVKPALIHANYTININQKIHALKSRNLWFIR